MQRIEKHLAAAAFALATGLATLPAPAAAAPAGGLIQPVQFRGYHRSYYGHRFYRGGYRHGPFRHGPFRHGPGFYHRGYGGHGERF